MEYFNYMKGKLRGEFEFNAIVCFLVVDCYIMDHQKINVHNNISVGIFTFYLFYSSEHLQNALECQKKKKFQYKICLSTDIATINVVNDGPLT